MKKIELQNVEPVNEAELAKLEQQAAPLRSLTEISRRRARQHRAKLARRITRRNAR